MIAGATDPRADLGRAELAERLAERRPEIEQAVLTRVYAISDPTEAKDPEYLEGLRAALDAALDYGLAAIERGEERAPPIPAVLLTQARIAARNGVSLDTVLRRYFAGYALLGDYLIEEAEREEPLQGNALKRLLRSQATLFDRLLIAVSEEHGREAPRGPDSAERRRAEVVEGLLAGELLDTSTLAYDLDGHHIGLIAHGVGAERVVRTLAGALDYRLLVIDRGEEVLWAWCGSRRRPDPRILLGHAGGVSHAEVTLAIGEPARGLEGWRLTHEQARAALSVALRGPPTIVRYADVVLLASVLKDDLLATSLRALYLEPLSQDRDGGATLRHTLRTYFDTDRNISSSAAALGVNRQTITNRLRTAEQKLNRPLSVCSAELEAALRLECLDTDRAPRRCAE